MSSDTSSLRDDIKKEETEKTDLERDLESLYLRVARLDGGGQTPKQDSILLTVPEGTTEEIQEGKRIKPEMRFSRTGIFSVFSLVFLSVFALFFWPTLYHYEVLNSAGKIYPLRIHRVTGDVRYFDGSQWLHPPIPVNSTQSISADPARSSVQVVTSGGVRRVDQGEILSSPERRNAGEGGRYAIQIKAYPENKKEDAKVFVEGLSARQRDIHMERVYIHGRGFWHRVLLGHFTSVEEASRYVNENRIFDSFPGSFIQRKKK